jgi:N-acyl homoserine lactone hydrolase
MKHFSIALLALLLLCGGMQAPPAAEPGPLRLWRLDCGSLVEPVPPLPWRRGNMPVSCYLIQNGSRYLLWDAGVSVRALGDAHPTIKLSRTLVAQLAEIGVRPEQVNFVGISHYHGDHTGQATAFPQARLLIGAGDLAVYRQPVLPGGIAPTHLKPWLEDGGEMTALEEDLDVFGDGRVTMLRTSGHTPGHTSLLVKLASRPVILSGDLWHSDEDVLRDRIPDFNTSYAETAASRERIRRLARELDAMLIIQHEQEDVADLPPFPEAAE